MDVVGERVLIKSQDTDVGMIALALVSKLPSPKLIYFTGKELG